MTNDAEKHLAYLKAEFGRLLEAKYRAGHEEHGGDLLEMSAFALVLEALKENIDQFVYLAEALRKLSS